MMSLVAYGSSGESDNESDTEVEPVLALNRSPVSTSIDKITNDRASAVQSVESEVPITKGGLHSKLPPPKTSIYKLNEDADSEESLGLGLKLPAPKHHAASLLLESSIVAPKNKDKKNKKGIVKIMIPSLSDFPEDEDEPKAKKKIQPSAKGSGLFAILPPPKQATVKEANRSLVPNVLTRKPTPVPLKSSTQPRKKKQLDSDPESDGENENIDFFSLMKEDKLPDIPVADVGALAASSSFQGPSSSYQPVESMEYQYQHDKEVESAVLPQADSGQDFISFAGSGDLQLDDEALKKLCGRQFKGRNREEIQIVDVSGDSIMPDQREWLTKQLTEEQPRHSSKSKLHGPSSQQKRKHQITYLAHVAKENELELKNQWANNRQSRKQTQSKYGF